jgi:hypothetical protein
LTEYAKVIGKSQQAVSKFREAAEVYTELHNLSCEVGSLIDKATHLFELHTAPPETWPLLAKAMLDGDWSVKDTHYNVEQILRFFEKDENGEYRYMVPEDWRFFLPNLEAATPGTRTGMERLAAQVFPL